MTFFSKSKQLKKLGKLTLPTGIFFINEGLIFGLPIFLNPVMFLPFIMIPPISGILTYYVMKIGLVPLAIGFQIPWTTPPIISGFIQGGIRLAVWQIVLIILQGFMWYPFFRIIDNKMTVTENRSKLNQ
ncbi:Lichenan permease IIC component [bioreactor metagenome]|uniref:Lichenan permease IIC component n=1 Tax=bioreactor metagenome TaxID=1076179 RepID=A0A645G8P8_9ZZZZ